MSWEASAWAKKSRVGGPALKALLLCLADYADPDDQSCYPGQDRLAADTEQSVRTVRRQLDQLETMGAITRTKRYRDDGPRTSDRCVLHVGRPIDVHRTTGQIDRESTTGQIDRSPEPEENGSGTAGDYRPSHAGDYRTQLCPGNNQRTTSKNPPPPKSQKLTQPTGPVAEEEDPHPDLETVMAVVVDAWRPRIGPSSEAGLRPLIAQRLEEGHHPDVLARLLTTNRGGVNVPLGILRSRVADMAAPTAPRAPLPPLCGGCDNRYISNDDDTVTPCPRCHPAALEAAS